MLRSPMRTAGSSPRWIRSYILDRGTPKYSAASGTFIHFRFSCSIAVAFLIVHF
jgi:hypothetical protein